MQSPLLVTTETQQDPSTDIVLVIDKKGIIGNALLATLTQTSLAVSVSQREPAQKTNSIHIPFTKRVPKIPDNVFSSIFVVYQGEKLLLKMLPAVIKKAVKTQATLVLIASMHQMTGQFIAELRRRNPAIKIVLYGDIFGAIISDNSPLNHLLLHAKLYGRILLSPEGLQRLYPVLFDDVISGVFRAAFGNYKESLFYLFPKHPPTELTVARLMQKIQPMLAIDFARRGTPLVAPLIPPGGIYLFGTEYPLEEKLQQVLAIIPSRSTTVVSVPARHDSQSQATHSLGKGLLLLMGGIIVCGVLLLSPLLIGGASLQAAQKALERGDSMGAERLARWAKQSFEVADTTSNPLVIVGNTLGAKKQTAILQGYIVVGKELATGAEAVITASRSFQEVFAGKAHNPKETFNAAIRQTKEAISVFQQLQAEKRLPQSILPKVQAASRAMQLFTNNTEALPTLFGFDTSKKYLVLFQNNFELRPGGGFIGSYGLLTMKDGRMQQFTIHDVYDADGQLTGHVEPPYPLRRYLGVKHWYLRDSNFDLDFRENAAMAANFLRMETGESVDGVLAIDTYFVRDLLSLVGPLYLPDYKEKISAETFFLLTERYAEKNFFPGSTQKKDILRATYNAVFLKLQSGNGVAPIQLLQNLTTALYEKHFLITFANQRMQQLFTVNNLSAALWDKRPTGPGAVNDFFGIVEANIGANKSNYYVTRRVEHNVMILDESTLTTSVTLRYENASKKESEFGGAYKNYVQFILPQGTQLTALFIDGKEQDIVDAITDPTRYERKGFVAPGGFEVERREQEGKSIVGFLLIVPEQTQREVHVVYTLPQKQYVTNASMQYSLRLFKQPGVERVPYAFTLSYPDTFTLVDAKQAVSIAGEMVYAGDLREDTDILIRFATHKR